MDKMKMETANQTLDNLAKLKEMFPEVITESKDENGEIVAAIDAKKLEQLLSTKVIDGDEGYDFTWVGKKRAMIEACKPIRKTLRPCREESVDWENTQNLYIEGDNLDVLKLLQESYLNKVKMIYIDPPYNTGNDSFIYPDDYSTNKDAYDEEVGAIDESGYRMFKNTETNGRFHSSWCSMMYPRLKLARNLLSDDGVIFISIDDHEVDNLKKICDEVYGENNFIAQFIVSSNSTKNNSKYVSVSHEYILCYCKNVYLLGDEWKVKKNYADEFEKRAKQLTNQGLSFDEIHNELLELVKYPRFYDFDHYTFADKKGVFRTDNSGGVTNGNFETEIIHPITKKPCAKPIGGWRYKEEEIKRLVENNMFYFGKDETIIPVPKRYLHDYMYQVPKSTLFFDSQSSTKWLKANKLPFDFSKSIDFIKYILSTSSREDDVILDFFSGSATTAHAVMQLNAEDGGKRKFIMIQLPEVCDEKSEAYKAGYKNICEIGKERIRRAGKKIKKETGKQDLDIGFRVLKLDSSNMKDVYYTPEEYNQTDLIDMASNIKDDRTPEDLLYACMLEWGLELSLPHKVQTVAGYNVHIVDDGALVACFDDKISEDAIKQIAELQPLRAVFRDSGFAGDAARVNVGEIFKLKSPNTTIKVL